MKAYKFSNILSMFTLICTMIVLQSISSFASTLNNNDPFIVQNADPGGVSVTSNDVIFDTFSYNIISPCFPASGAYSVDYVVQIIPDTVVDPQIRWCTYTSYINLLSDAGQNKENQARLLKLEGL
jgi:hypothetical protein